MERLTKPAVHKTGNKYVSAIGSGHGAWPQIIQRLAAYENTGLEPEEIEETDKWISVTDHLPKNDYGTHWKERAYYLVRLRNGTMRVAHYGYKEYDWWIDSHNCVLSKERYTEVTHWRRLPAQPKED